MLFEDGGGRMNMQRDLRECLLLLSRDICTRGLKLLLTRDLFGRQSDEALLVKQDERSSNLTKLELRFCGKLVLGQYLNSSLAVSCPLCTTREKNTDELKRVLQKSCGKKVKSEFICIWHHAVSR